VQSVLNGAIEEFRPNLIGISVRNIDDQNMGNPRFLLDQIKEIVAACRGLSEAPIVLGGAGYSIFPGSALSFLGADMGIEGEGEVVFPELIKRMGRGADLSGLPGLYLSGRGLQGRRIFAKHLDTLPLPTVDLWSIPLGKGDLWMPVQTRRGCPLNCSYCSTGTIEGRRIRRHSPQAMVRWIGSLEKAGVRQFYFVDNTFNLPPVYAKNRRVYRFRPEYKMVVHPLPRHVDQNWYGVWLKPVVSRWYGGLKVALNES
jgi:radical SAM superfamily enzyme YgiQ (UPF0313 family)